MVAPNTPQDPGEVPEAVVDEQSKGFPVVWLLPLVALLIGAWLMYKAISEKGPEITISFETAEGIVEGKTTIKYRDVTVGQVEAVTISDDLSSILVTATMSPDAKPYMTDATRFWVVRPRVGVGGISGLGTLVSGAYIAMDPDKSGESTKTFVGLEKPPIVTSDKEGTSYRLRAEKLGSLSVGSPIYFKQFDVGEITDYKLAPDHDYVDVGIFVQTPHDQYVREGTRFWNVGGVSVSMDASGVKVEMESVVSLISGGIAFETHTDLMQTPLAAENRIFRLYDNHTKSLEQPITEVITFLVRFSGGVRGLSIGAPVEFRGVRIGTVRAIEMGADPKQREVVAPVVLIDIEPQRTEGHTYIDALEEHGKYEENPIDRIREMVGKGLRARLQTGNLVTGQLYVDVDMFPDAEPATLIEVGRYPEIPTMPNPLEGILAGINRILNKLEAADLEQTLTNLNELMVSTSGLMATLEKDTPAIADELHATLRQAQSTLTALEASASPDGEIGSELQRALSELSAAARSIRVMAEYLERHPEAMLKGKGSNP